MPAGAVPVVVQGHRIGHALVKPDGSMRIQIDGIRSEFEGRTGFESSRIFDLDKPPSITVSGHISKDTITMFTMDGVVTRTIEMEEENDEDS